jgi:hypothetical protein
MVKISRPAAQLTALGAQDRWNTQADQQLGSAPWVIRHRTWQGRTASRPAAPTRTTGGSVCRCLHRLCCGDLRSARIASQSRDSGQIGLIRVARSPRPCRLDLPPQDFYPWNYLSDPMPEGICKRHHAGMRATTTMGEAGISRACEASRPGGAMLASCAEKSTFYPKCRGRRRR